MATSLSDVRFFHFMTFYVAVSSLLFLVLETHLWSPELLQVILQDSESKKGTQTRHTHLKAEICLHIAPGGCLTIFSPNWDDHWELIKLWIIFNLEGTFDGSWCGATIAFWRKQKKSVWGIWANISIPAFLMFYYPQNSPIATVSNGSPAATIEIGLKITENITIYFA